VVDRWTGETGGPVRPVDGGPVRPVRSVNGGLVRPVRPVNGGPVDGGPVIHRQLCIDSTDK
jgi:hypothetical protein